MHGRQYVLGLSALLLGITAIGQECWTNTAGHAFSAKLISLTDTHATFVMTNGETNTLAVAALSPASQTAARAMHQMPEIPDRLQSTFSICRRDLERLADLHKDGRLNAEQFDDAREAILRGFKSMCSKHGLPEEKYPALRERLLADVPSTPERRAGPTHADE